MVALSTWPLLNACLNGTSALLIGSGFVAIRRRRIAVHKACMLAACATSVLFLVSYLLYHHQVGSTAFHRAGRGPCRVLCGAAFAHHSRRGDRAAGRHDGVPGMAGTVAASSAVGALDAPPVALRIGYRCGHLRHVVSTVIAIPVKIDGMRCTRLSFPRKRESTDPVKPWTPAFAGVTALFSSLLCGSQGHGNSYKTGGSYETPLATP